MFLKEIRLRHFKCFEAFEMSFESKVNEGFPARKNTFLVGQNGTGKTALLQAAALLTASSDTLLHLPFLPEASIKSRKRSCEIEAVFITHSGVTCSHSLHLQQGQSRADFLKKNAGSLNAIKKANGEKEPEVLIAGYGSLRSAGLRSPATGKVKPERQVINSLFSMEHSLYAFDVIAGAFQKNGGTPAIRNLCQALDKFLPPEIRCKGYSTIKAGFQFQTPGAVLAHGQLANGWQQLINWLANLAFQIAPYSGFNKNPFEATGILMIDEPDLHLHPLWQRRLPTLLDQHMPNMQVIVSTHSPLLAQQAGQDELYALHRDEPNNVELMPFAGEPYQLLPHQLLMSPMFGLETDESWKVEATKTMLREAARHKANTTRKKNTAQAGAQPNALSTAAADTRINVRSNSNTEPEDLVLLRQINEALHQDVQEKTKKR